MRLLPTILFLCLCLVHGLPGAENLWPNPGFESWNRTDDTPATPAWRWGIQKMEGGGEFEFLGQSSEQSHSGQYSLLMKDTNPGHVNNVLYYSFTREEAKAFGGKILTLAAWVKQIRASAPRKVGIGLTCYTAGGKHHNAFDWIDTAEETGWTHLRARLRIPEDAVDLRAVLYCANHFNNTAEAYFDDVILTTGTVTKQPPEPLKAVASGDEANAASRLPVIPPPRTWRLYCHAYAPAQPVESAPVILERQKSAQDSPLAMMEARTDLLNRRYSLQGIAQGSLGFSAVLSHNLSFWVNLTDAAGKTATIKLEGGQEDGSGRFRYHGVFAQHPAELRSVSVHMDAQQLKGIPQFTVFEMALTSPAGSPGFAFAPSPWLQRYIREYQTPFSVDNDPRPRPVIRSGTWFQNGRYQYLLGPWIYNQTVDWQDPVRNNPLKINHIAYTNPPGKKVFDAMAFNSAQMSAAPSWPGQALYGLGVPENIEQQEKGFAAYTEGFAGMPLVVDFAFSFDQELAFQDPEKRREIDQRCGSWHAFNPACPEHPEGDRFYHDLIDGGTKILMKSRMNVSVYELFNESVYACQCSYNIRAFAQAMEKKYGTMEQANRAWQTIFTDFAELGDSSSLHQYPGLWVEWWHFIANRYVEVLQRYKQLVRQTDRRPDVYFCEMLAVSQIWNSFTDYRAVAKAMDVLAIEGGWRYGHSSGALHSTNGMEDVVFSAGTHWYVCDFFAALAKGKKPVINNEHYCWRAENGLRVPSKGTDMITSLWMEIMHGSSGNFTYVLDKRSYDYRTAEEARQNVIVPGYKSSSLLNPYNWPPSELDAFQRFTRELEPYRERILPFPRTKAPTVAVYHSYTTHAMNQLERGLEFRDRMQRWYSALLHQHYPVTFIFDDDLAAGLPENIRAVVVPCAEYETDAAIAGLRRFAERGGLVIADKDAFSFTEHAVKRPPQSPDVFRRIDSRHGRSTPQLLALLAENRIPRHGTLTATDGNPQLDGTDLQIIDRGDFKLVFAAGMIDIVPRKVRLQLNLTDEGSFYLTDIVNRRLYLSGQNEQWTSAQLRTGFQTILPPQERAVFVLERKRPQDVQPWSQSQVEAEFAKSEQESRRILAAEQARADAQAKAESEARIFRDAAPDKCESVDLRNFVNMHFRDEKGGDRKGGGFDQGAKDFSNIRPGRIMAAGVPFEIIDADRNHGRGLIILAGRDRDYFPLEVRGIPVSGKARYLYFLHTMGWGGDEGAPIMSYAVTYQDGTRVEIPIRSKLEIGPWMDGRKAFMPKAAKIGLESSNNEGPLSFQNYRWINPYPEKPLRSIDIVSTCGDGVPAIAAITVERP